MNTRFFTSLLVAVILMIAMVRICHAQDSTSTRSERIEGVVGSSLAFSLFDYLVFNKLRDNERWVVTKRTLSLYHNALGVVQAAISYVLYRKLGLPSTISFNLMWWSWTDDLLFYGWSYLLDPVFRW